MTLTGMLSNCIQCQPHHRHRLKYPGCTYAHRLQHVLGLLVHIQHTALAVLGEVERRHLRHVLILPLTLLFLQLERDAAHGAALDTLHQVGGVAGDLYSTSVRNCSLHAVLVLASAYLVPQPLAGNDSDLIAYPLVGLEVEGELGVVSLDDDLGGLQWLQLALLVHEDPNAASGILLRRVLVVMEVHTFLTVFVRTRPMFAVLLVGGRRRLKFAGFALEVEIRSQAHTNFRKNWRADHVILPQAFNSLFFFPSCPYRRTPIL